jgi:hypothetical protein
MAEFNRTPVRRLEEIARALDVAQFPGCYGEEPRRKCPGVFARALPSLLVALRVVVRKTHRELNELVEALRISLKAYDAKLKQLGVDWSECDVNTVSHVFVLESDNLGVVDFNHTQRRLWIVHFTDAAKDGWGLYEEAARADRVECAGGYCLSQQALVEAG